MTDLALVLLSIRGNRLHSMTCAQNHCLYRSPGKFEDARKFKDEYDTGVATHQEVTDHGTLHLPPLVIQRSCQFLD